MTKIKRMLTPKAGAMALLGNGPGRLHFAGRTRADWVRWRRGFGGALGKLLGARPPVGRKGPPRVRVVERVTCAGYERQKIEFESDVFSTVPAYLLVPEGIEPGGKRPGVLVAHGHGNGKADVVGLTGEPERSLYKEVAVQVCRAGHVVIAPDWRSFGERRDAAEYVGHWGAEHGSDGCDLSYMVYGYFGYQMLMLDVCDAMRCLDVLAARKDVDASRLGMIGCSFGGTMTTYTAALDRRIKAAVITCYLSSVEDAINDRGRGNTCGSQFLFGLRAIGDVSDVAGLIAPRPCLVQVGTRDTCFVEPDAMRAYEHLRRIYRAAGAPRALELDRFDGVHEHHMPPALEFLKRTLG